VGNYPGRAMGFVVNKATGEAKVTHLPSKHMGVFLNEDTVRILSPSFNAAAARDMTQLYDDCGHGVRSLVHAVRVA
jgi:hypothetical protein